MHALCDREVDVRRQARRQLAIEPDADAVDARIAVVAVEHADAGEQRKGTRRRRAGRQQIRPHGHVGKRREPRVAKVALLLNAVRRNRSHLGEHVLPGVVDAGAAADDRLAVLRDIPRKPGSRLNLLPLMVNRAVGGESRIVQEDRVRRGLRVDGCRHQLRVPAESVVDGQPVTHLPFVLNEQRELLVVDVRRSRLVARDAVRAAALEVKQQRTAGRRRAGGAACRRRDVRAVRAAHGERPESARRRR